MKQMLEEIEKENKENQNDQIQQQENNDNAQKLGRRTFKIRREISIGKRINSDSIEYSEIEIQ